ncbi:Gfo/Idh/MocA family oxidoreductase [Saccharopolyspora sp. HNM0983]|uniref:Gfo/Idh/MocA family oxidoreductase n=1 Tax=Saccharopolyspora montiporae TaxID=2781240 RepID=A0A929G0K5_9PSEU|nr:Gfo/Idh/MocA family oxidoreductase [Saccharopolyspora sp. HNM0983]MBE9375429.1 Gfo/Idh/MocA family oxidoreductase [Saccharopolyspora sp. HNM0983]
MRSNSALRVGLIGAGRMGGQHAGFLARDQGVELVAVADPVDDRIAAEHGARQFTDHRDLLASPGLDAVLVASPNHLHVPMALDCIAAGVPVLLEKPVATSHAAAAELVAAEAAADVPVLVGHHRRHHPAVTAAREIIRSGGIGDLVAVNGTWLTRKDDAYFEQSWRREPGAGVLLINLVHDLDLLRYLCGEITGVQACTSNAVRGYDVEETAAVIVRFAGSAVGSFLISDAVVAPWGWDQATEDDPTFPYRPDGSCYSIAGTRGSLSFPQLAHYYHEGRSDWTQPLSVRFEPKAAGDSYSNQLAHFARVVRGEEEPAVSVADAARTLAVVEAVSRAAGSGVVEPIGAQ